MGFSEKEIHHMLPSVISVRLRRIASSVIFKVYKFILIKLLKFPSQDSNSSIKHVVLLNLEGCISLFS